MEKRIRLDNSTNTATTPSRIFHPYRAVGHVTTSVPVQLELRGSEYFITASVGSAFQIYALSKLRLKFVSEPVTEGADILGFAIAGNYTFVSTTAGNIEKYQRAKRVQILKTEKKSCAFSMLAFGDYLISLHENNSMCIWMISSGELYMEIPFPESSFSLSCLMHPSTYLNKIVVASQQGGMQIWNIRTGKKIYEFKSLGSAVTCMFQSPVVDVVAIGLADGRILVYNIKTDKQVMQFKQSGHVSSISFRTDEYHFMATSSINGEIAIWDLEEKRLVHVMNNAHSGSIQSLFYLHGKPSLVTSSSDNSIKQWMFDSLDGAPRLLRSRSGHHAPPSHVRYYDTEGKYMLSAGSDKSLRVFCTFRDEQNMELSQGSIERKAKMRNCTMDDIKLAQIVDFSSATIRENDWDNILTCHAHGKSAKTWNYKRRALGSQSFKSLDGSIIKCVAVSNCGNFGYIGCSSGRVDMFNMQSGQHRRHFGAADHQNQHQMSITGLIPDPCNSKVITSSLDGSLKFWDWSSGKMLSQMQLNSAITQIEFHFDNSLLAVASDDFSIRLVDIDTCKVVREFYGHDNRVTDMAFSPDGRWLISSSLDSTIRTWDIPSGCLVDAFQTKSVPTSIAFSPTADMLISTHVNSVGLSMWSNKLQYSSVVLRKLPEDFEIQMAEMPNVAGTSDDIDELPEDDLVNYDYASPEQLADSMVTLSVEPRSKWHNLLHIDIIKKHNKPKEPAKAPEKAPFFLPTTPGLEPKFAVESDKQTGGDDGTVGASSQMKFSSLGLETEFVKRLRADHDSGKYMEFVKYMKTLSPSSMDFELKMLDSSNEYADLRKLMEIIIMAMQHNRDYELLQAYMNVILKIHTDVFVQHGGLFKDLLSKYAGEQKKTWGRLNDMLQQCICIIDFIK